MNKQRQVYIFILNIVLTVLFCFSNALAQPENLSLLREANIGITNAANANPFQFHTSIRPYLQNEIQVLNAPSEKDTAMPSSKKMGAMGATIDVPLGHKDAAYVRSHFDAIEARVTDAPRANEIVVCVAVTDSGRPNPRVGGLKHQDMIGKDGLN